MAIAASQGNNYLRRSSPSGLADVLNVILDKGLVVDIYLRVALVGIELLTVDARIVVASVDTYLRFAEAVNRLDLTQVGEHETLPGLIENLQESGAKRKTRGVLEGAKEKILGGGDDSDDDEKSSRSSSSRSSGSSKSSSSSGNRRARSRSTSGGSKS